MIYLIYMCLLTPIMTPAYRERLTPTLESLYRHVSTISQSGCREINAALTVLQDKDSAEPAVCRECLKSFLLINTEAHHWGVDGGCQPKSQLTTCVLELQIFLCVLLPDMLHRIRKQSATSGDMLLPAQGHPEGHSANRRAL